MATQDVINIAATVLSILAVVVPTLFKLGVKFQALQADIAGLRIQLTAMEKDLAEVKDGLLEARTARQELWQEINNLRERTTRLRTVVSLKEV